MKSKKEEGREPGEKRKHVLLLSGQAQCSVLTPDVRFDGEFVVGQALGCGPFDRELGSCMGCVSVPGH